MTIFNARLQRHTNTILIAFQYINKLTQVQFMLETVTTLKDIYIGQEKHIQKIIQQD